MSKLNNLRVYIHTKVVWNNGASDSALLKFMCALNVYIIILLL